MVKRRKRRPRGRQAIVAAMAKAGSTELSPARIYRAEEVVPSNIVPTGHDNLDLALGIGGLPAGRIATFYGPPGCGKTSFALQLTALVQKLGGVGVYYDFEDKLDLPYAEMLGIDMDYFIHDKPAYIEEALAKTEEYLGVLREEDPNAPVIFVWDSVSSAKSKMSFEGKWEDHNWASESRIYSDKLPKFVRLVARTQAIIIGITQKRVSMAGGRTQNKIGPGSAWQHHNTVILSWVKHTKLKKVTKPGELSEIEVTKNQVGTAWHRAELLFEYGAGYNPYYSTFQAALSKGLIGKSGSWYSMGDKQIGQGKDLVIEKLASDPALLEAVRKELRSDIVAKVVGTDDDED